MEIKIIYWNVPKYTLYDAEHNFYASNDNFMSVTFYDSAELIHLNKTFKI